MDICAICGRPAECTHHLIGGTSGRKLSDADGLVIRLCHNHHNMAIDATERIHGNPMAEKLSKMLGQAMWELNAIADKEQQEQARQSFIKRYGRSWLWEDLDTIGTT